MARGQSITLRTVADAADVSTATVSRVLSGLPGAGPDVRERVLRTADELGYRVDLSARSLRMRRSDVLGLVVPDIVNPFFPALVQAVEAGVQGSDREVLFADSQDSVATEAKRITALVDRRVDALIISPTDARRSTEAVAWAAERLPVVQIDRTTEADVPYVGADNAAAMREIVQHLSDVGRTRPAYVGYSDAVSTSEERLSTFRSLTETDPDAEHRVVREHDIADPTAFSAWLSSSLGSFDAVITTSDILAVALKLEIQSHGLRVPDDVAIVAFDDTRLAAAAQITSFRQPLHDMALAALSLIDEPQTATQARALRGRLIVRASSS